MCRCVLVCIRRCWGEMRRHSLVGSLGVSQEANTGPSEVWTGSHLQKKQKQHPTLFCPCLSLHRFSSQCDLFNKASLLSRWLVLGGLSLGTALKLHIYLDNTPGILIDCTVWRWHNHFVLVCIWLLNLGFLPFFGLDPRDERGSWLCFVKTTMSSPRLPDEYTRAWRKTH